MSATADTMSSELSSRVFGVLALQGAFREHRRMIERLGAGSREVRLPKHLEGLSGLILPGGESTTIGKLLVEWKLLEPIREMGLGGLPIWGSCAGAILLAKRIRERGKEMDQPRLGLMDMTAVRNAFGRQVDSFEADLNVATLDEPFRGVFIRAPLFELDGQGVQSLCTVENQEVFVRQGHLLATSFHPELTDDSRLHSYFIQLAAKEVAQPPNDIAASRSLS